MTWLGNGRGLCILDAVRERERVLPLGDSWEKGGGFASGSQLGKGRGLCLYDAVGERDRVFFLFWTVRERKGVLPL